MAIEHDSAYFIEMLDGLDTGNSHPRIIAIVVASYIEDYLIRLVQTRMPGLSHKKDDKTKSKLFSNSGPLSTNAANIELAKALGLIESDLQLEMITIARIRNRFAHNLRINDFEHPEIDHLCKKLQLHFNFNIKHYSHMSNNAKVFCASSINVAMMLNNMLASHASRVKKINQVINLYNDSSATEITASLKLLRSRLASVSSKT